jgi:hypothetical protein
MFGQKQGSQAATVSQPMQTGKLCLNANESSADRRHRVETQTQGH